MVFKIEYRVGVAAPVDDVYDLLTDINAWPSWSPIHKAATGELRFGAPVHFEEYYEGLGTWEIDGFVADWTPLSHIHISVPKPFYAGTLTRYYELEALSGTGSVFSVGAAFTGFLSVREGKRFAKYLRKGFEAMGEAVKTQAEANFAKNPHPVRNIDPPVTPPGKPAKDKKPLWAPPKAFGQK